MKLLIVVNDAAFFFSHRLDLARSAQSAGFEVHVATPPSRRIAEIEAFGFFYHAVPMRRKSINPFTDFFTFLTLFKLYRQLKPNLVHHVSTKPIVYGGIAARLTKVPAVVNTVTGLGYLFISKSFGIRVLRQLVKIAYKIAFMHPHCKIIFQNRDDQEIFYKKDRYYEKPIIVPGSGVDVDKFFPVLAEGELPIVLLASRMLWDKGVGEFVKAAEQLRSQIKARFVLVGDVDINNPASVPKTSLQQWVEHNIVEWWGWKNDMPQIISQAHIVCLPSYREGLPKVLIEAAAAGKPIVTTDVPGCRDVVKDGYNGFLVPAKNTEELAKALLKLIQNEELRKIMGQRNRILSEEKFSSRLINQKILNIYSSLLYQEINL